MKKISLASAMLLLLFGMAPGFAAHAQLFPYTATTTPSSTFSSATSSTSTVSTATEPTMVLTPSGTTVTVLAATSSPSVAPAATTTYPTSSATVPSSSVSPIYVTTSPALPAAPASGWLQFNGLVVNDVTFTNNTWEILASNQSEMSLAPNTQLATSSWGTCQSFETASASLGTVVTCPAQPVITIASGSLETSLNSTGMPVTSSATGINGSSATMLATTPTAITLPLYSPYQININAGTNLLLSDRTVGAIADFTPGDFINVFGFYEPDGIIQASIVRDLSKPIGTPTYSLPALGTTTLESLVSSLETIITQLTQSVINETSSASAPMIPYTGTVVPTSNTSSPTILGTSSVPNSTPTQISPSPGSTASSSASGTASGTS